MQKFIVSAGNPSLRKDNLFNGLVPKTFVFGLVESEAFNGALKKNPYNFQHFNVSSIGITVNGEEMPFKPLQLSYGAAPKYIEAFSTLFSGTGKMYHNTGNDISRDEFPKGYAVYAFDLFIYFLIIIIFIQDTHITNVFFSGVLQRICVEPLLILT